MKKQSSLVRLCASAALYCLAGCSSIPRQVMPTVADFRLDYETPVDSALQTHLEALDARLRRRLAIEPDRTRVGVLDLKTLRLALVRPDTIDYAASVPKIGILLAYFERNPWASTNLDAPTRNELGLMIKQSDNDLAAKYSQMIGLKNIESILASYGFYDAERGGGLWLGKHYGQAGERFGDPVANHSHAATVRQLLRFYLALEQGKLVSPEASRTMQEIFSSPNIPHRQDMFVKGLAGRNVQVLRKAGWWEDWFHDTAIIRGTDRHYIIVGMTHHPRGEEYLVDFARAVDDLLAR